VDPSLREFLISRFGAEVDAFGYGIEEWVEAVESLRPHCPGSTVERLAGYVACCAEAGEKTGRLLPLKDEVLRHFKTFGLEP
jgi:hypothetical protein